MGIFGGGHFFSELEGDLIQLSRIWGMGIFKGVFMWSMNSFYGA